MPDNLLPMIDYEDLMRSLSDPSTDLDHYLRYMVEVPSFDQMVSELHPNPALVREIPPAVEGGFFLGAANRFMRARRQAAYRQRLADGWKGHRIVSEGDSWFQYPTALQDIIDHLMDDHAILSFGAAGDRLIDMQSQKEVLINLQRERASALLLSAGGNDLFDNGRMGELVEEPFPGATIDDLVGRTFEAFLRDILGRYLHIFLTVHTALPHVHILTHGYANAFPSGDRWIQQPLTKRGVPRDQQHDVVKRMVKRFNEGLVQLSNRPELHEKVVHIDLTSIGNKPDDWHNEIHLNGQAAANAAEKFRKVLKQRLSGPIPETGIAQSAPPPSARVIVSQAETFAAFDEATLLDELDLRVALLEMDPNVASEVIPESLALRRAQPELGIASLRNATRTLLRMWEENLRELLCGTGPNSDTENAILKAVDKGKSALSGAIAAWLISGPFGVPGVLASTLAAWLASKVVDLGIATICAHWTPRTATAPMLAARVPVPEGGVMTFGDMRARMITPHGAVDLSNDGQKTRLEALGEIVAKGVVENPSVPVDANGAKQFRLSQKEILARLGAEPDDALVPENQIATVEAIVQVDGSRPSLCVRDGFVDLDDPLLINSGWRDELVQHESGIRAMIRASGRIIQRSDRSANNVYGSAWMLSGGRVATARHVIEAMTSGSPNLADRFYVDFSVEADRPMDPSKVFRISEVDWAGPAVINGMVLPGRMDAAVLKLEPMEGRALPETVPLLESDDADAVSLGKWFMNVGHPRRPQGAWLTDVEGGEDGKL